MLLLLVECVSDVKALDDSTLNQLITMYIYHALIDALTAHMIHINLNTVFHTHVELSPTKKTDIRYYMETHTHTHLSLIHISEPTRRA